MTNDQDKLNHLLAKLDSLFKKHNELYKEIDDLRVEISSLNKSATEPKTKNEDLKHHEPLTYLDVQIKNESPTSHSPFQEQRTQQSKQDFLPLNRPPKVKSDLEKFIGENLINKIGIAITVIGVAIGAKYAIDHQLISPLTRIILGYMVGTGLLGFAIKLKQKYENFSSVLLSGSMAIMYFITYAAYSYYALFPQIFAFALMVIFTAFTVLAAIKYNKQVIAQIGLVGAYAVPFLLSEGSGKVAILFAYMAIINVGILVIGIKKYWKSLYYSSFTMTWLIYFVWYVSKYERDDHFGLALTFLSVFFAIFYLTFLAYKLIQKEKFEIGDIIMLLANSFVFYGIGYAILNGHHTGKQVLGLFTLSNGIVHFIISAIIYRKRLADRNLFYLISGLVLVFVTIAIPVQLDGNWVTLLWAGEAALLFWIGRTKNVPAYEKLSYPLILLAFISIVHDWIAVYDRYDPIKPETTTTPLLNINFFTSLLFIAAFAFINRLNRSKKHPSPLVPAKGFLKIISFAIPAILLFTIYYTFRAEISIYWDRLYANSLITVKVEDQFKSYRWNENLGQFKTIWIINYSLFFVSLLAFVNFRRLRNQQLGLINLGLIILTLAFFFVEGIYVLNNLRETYLTQSLSKYYHVGWFNIGIRYVSFAFVALSLIACYRYTKQDFLRKDFTMAYDFLLHISVLLIASSELINWMDLSGSAQTYKLGLSILWGIYSLFLISLGIAGKKKHLRVGAIGLFGITLLKLFFYDISHFGTLAKTIVFVSLGVLLLVISFLYNKYTHLISDDTSH